MCAADVDGTTVTESQVNQTAGSLDRQKTLAWPQAYSLNASFSLSAHALLSMELQVVVEYLEERYKHSGTQLIPDNPAHAAKVSACRLLPSLHVIHQAELEKISCTAQLWCHRQSISPAAQGVHIELIVLCLLWATSALINWPQGPRLLPAQACCGALRYEFNCLCDPLQARIFRELFTPSFGMFGILFGKTQQEVEAGKAKLLHGMEVRRSAAHSANQIAGSTSAQHQAQSHILSEQRHIEQQGLSRPSTCTSLICRHEAQFPQNCQGLASCLDGSSYANYAVRYKAFSQTQLDALPLPCRSSTRT